MKKIDELRPGMEFSTAELSGSSKDKNNGPTLGTGTSSFQSQTQSSKAQDKTHSLPLQGCKAQHLEFLNQEVQLTK